MVSKINDLSWQTEEMIDKTQTSYMSWIIGSFVMSSLVHHVLSPQIFGRFLPAYRNLGYYKQREWDSRVLSTLHAICVCHFGLTSLFSDFNIWYYPIEELNLSHRVSHEGNIAMAIAAGYMVCDLISMPFYYGGVGLISFVAHHITVLISAAIILIYRKGCFFAIFRLVTEMSTPFLNLRWFLRTLGRQNGERPVRIAAYSFFAAFYISRIFSIPVFWYIFYSWYGTKEFYRATANMPYITEIGMGAAITLDTLNIIWAKSVFAVFCRTYRTSHVDRPLTTFFKDTKSMSVSNDIPESGKSKSE